MDVNILFYRELKKKNNFAIIYYSSEGIDKYGKNKD